MPVVPTDGLPAVCGMAATGFGLYWMDGLKTSPNPGTDGTIPIPDIPMFEGIPDETDGVVAPAISDVAGLAEQNIWGPKYNYVII